MVPCSGCKRHLHEADVVCPFCATEQRTVGSLRSSVGAFVLAVTMLGASACAKDSISADDTQTSGSTDDSTTTTATDSSDSDSTSSTQGDTSDSASDTFDTSLSFYAGPDDSVHVSQCDPFAQDCPEGEKCVPYASTGGTWDANKCVPVMGDGAPGEPCTSGGIVEGTDDCDINSLCWNVVDDGGEPIGTCTQFCTGTPDDPICPEQTSCSIANEGSINLCIETCDPLLQECPEGLGCYWGTQDFNCFSTLDDTSLGQACDMVNSCAPGLACLIASVLPDCDGAACCGSFCSLTEPVCPQPGTECTDFFEEDMAPPQYQNVGICVVPGA